MNDLDAPVRALFDGIAAPAAKGPPDLSSIGAELLKLAGDLDYLLPWVERLGAEPGAKGLPLHAPAVGPRLVLVHRPEGGMGPIHDHGTWVAIASISGLETHRRYRWVAKGMDTRIELVEALELGQTQSATLLPPDDIHAHGHVTGRGDPAYILILTGDDQTRFTRNEWDLATGRHRILHPGDPGRWLVTEPMPD